MLNFSLIELPVNIVQMDPNFNRFFFYKYGTKLGGASVTFCNFHFKDHVRTTLIYLLGWPIKTKVSKCYALTT